MGLITKFVWFQVGLVISPIVESLNIYKMKKIKVIFQKIYNGLGDLAITGVILCIIFSPAFLSDWLDGVVARQDREARQAKSLFLPHSGNLSIETTVIEKKDGEIITTKKTLNGVTFAQLKLYPTIGCTRPVLFYLADNSQQIKQLPVDEAKIIE
jgi:heme exporter protein D